MIVDIAATQPHYIDHIAPIWHELNDDERGDVIIPDALRDYAAALGVRRGHNQRARDIILTAGFSDANGARGWRTRVLMEHGVGQTYANRHRSYAGGDGREGLADLFICPNDRVADLNRPYGQTAVVGSPYLDELRKLDHYRSDLVVSSFHWNCNVTRETQSARVVYEDAIAALDRPTAFHAHPRDRAAVEGACRRTDRTFYPWFEDVVRHAGVFMCDNSSAMFYAAALGIPVVVLNAPWYRMNVHHGLRFWEHADIGPQVWRSADLDFAIEAAVRGDYRAAIQNMVDDLFPHSDGESAKRVVDILRSW